MRNKLAVLFVAVFVLASATMFMPKKANAIPAFSQKYHFSCTVCHTVFPNLNPFGRAFWRNGFRIPGTEGTPADATQITQGLSLPNPWPVPIAFIAQIGYQHYTNENVNPSTDAFNVYPSFFTGGAFKLYTPLADSLSFWLHFGVDPGGPVKLHQVFASINGIGNGFGVSPHLLNLKLGQVTTASPYFYRQAPFLLIEGPEILGDGLSVGNDGEAGAMLHSRNAGFALYGTPGYHLWYKVTVTNDAGGGVGTASGGGDSVSNAMEYSYQLKEYAQIPMGQLEFGYYGATVAEPLTVAGQGTWTNSVTVNGIDADIANDVYELGATYMVQNDSNPYTYSGGTLPAGVTDTSNGYSEFEIYGRYLFPTLFGNGVMLSADYATYSWTHKDSQEAFIGNTPGGNCSNQNIYGGGYLLNNGCYTDGIKDTLDMQVEVNLAANADLYFEYLLTNNDQANTLGTGLVISF